MYKYNTLTNITKSRSRNKVDFNSDTYSTFVKYKLKELGK